eukprot:166652-Hanusia_phi.AAC.2
MRSMTGGTGTETSSGLRTREGFPSCTLSGEVDLCSLNRRNKQRAGVHQDLDVVQPDASSSKRFLEWKEQPVHPDRVFHCKVKPHAQEHLDRLPRR